MTIYVSSQIKFKMGCPGVLTQRQSSSYILLLEKKCYLFVDFNLSCLIFKSHGIVLVWFCFFGRDNLLVRTNAEEMLSQLHTNLLGSMLTCRAAVKTMIKQQSGSIVNVGESSPLRVWYCLWHHRNLVNWFGAYLPVKLLQNVSLLSMEKGFY